MAEPKLAMIPSGYKANKVFSVLPSNGDGDFNFSRGSTATRVNSQGLIETVSNDLPRLNYSLLDGVVQECPSLLLEDEATNLIPYSEDYSNVSWNKLGSGTGTTSVITSNYAISPDGTQNASRLVCTLNNGGTISDQSLIYALDASNTSQSISVYMKSNNGSNQNIYFANTFGADDTVVVTNEWKRFEFNHSTTNNTFSLGLRGGTGADNTADILIWGSQSEAQSYATSYIPTNGGIETRLTETCNGAGTSDTFNDSEGVLMAEISALADDGTFRLITLSDGTTSNRLSLGYRSTSNAIYCEIRNVNASQAFLITTINDVKTKSKVSVKYKANDFALWVNGFEVSTDTSGLTPINLSKISLDSGQQNGGYFYGNTKQIQYFDTALTNSELETLTSWVSFQEMAQSLNYTIQ